MASKAQWRVSRTLDRLHARLVAAAIAAFVVLFLAALPAVSTVGSAGLKAATIAPSSTVGTDFWVAFEANYDGQNSRFLFIASATPTTGSVAVPGTGYTVGFTAGPGAPASVELPPAAQNMTSDKIGQDAVHVLAQQPVSVHGMSTMQFTSDGFLAIPTDSLGTDYIVEAYTNYLNYGSQFEVVATQEATAVTVIPNETVGSHSAGVPYRVTLNAGQSYQLTDSGVRNGDLTGTRISADKPIAVFAGDQCSGIPLGGVACNTLAEQMTPVQTWGHTFVTEPFATRSGDRFRVMASQDNTTVTFDGLTAATLSAGKYYETARNGPTVITADKPVHVMQYSQSNSVDKATGDPFAVTIPPTAQFLNSYTVQTPPHAADPQLASNFLNIVVATGAAEGVRVDGQIVDSTRFSPIPGSGYMGAQIGVTFGAHTVDSSVPVGVTLYGFGTADGYGYPGGFTLAPISTAITVSLAAPAPSPAVVSSQTCLWATVNDLSGSPLSDVRVDFAAAGANVATGFAYADTQGKAKFCYTGAAIGSDSITAHVDTVMSNVQRVDWLQVAPAATGTPAPTLTPSPTPSPSPSPSPTATPGPTPSPSPASTAVPVVTPTPTPTPTMTPTATSTPTPQPTSCAGANTPRLNVLTSAFGSPGRSVLTSPKISTVDGGQLVLAFVGVDGPFAPTQTVTAVAGGGLSWSLVARANETWGSTEVWQAYSGVPLAGLTVTAKFAQQGFDGLITVASFSGTGVRVGSSAVAYGLNGQPGVTLPPARCGSLVWGVGHDWTTDARVTAPAGQCIIRQFIDARVHDSFWVQRYERPTTQGQQVRLGVTGPTLDRWTYAAVEIAAS